MTNLKQIADLANVSILTAYQALREYGEVAADVRQRVRHAADESGYTLNVTIRDVAALAGVSVGTVSHVLNDSPLTKPETRQRVLQAISDLEYRRNSIARGLKSNQSRLIGYAWHSAEDPIRRNTLLDRFLYDIAQAAESWGYHILTFAQPDPTSIRSYEELIQMTRVDGFVLSDIAYNDARIAYLRKTGVPFVAFGQSRPDWQIPSVDVDGQLGMRMAVEHLLARGHERVALLSWPEGVRIGDSRAQGYMDAMRSAGIEPPPQWVGHTRNAVDHALFATQQLLAATPRPTAIACANDVMAFGVMRYLEQAGLRVGVDVAVTGYDDTPVAELLQLTSVRQPTDVVAVRVIEMLIGEIQETPVARRNVLLEPSLVVRASSRSQR
ncbi:LacI family DNA-binding transcriptional regulator [Chloroflexia bacterium SDU3-3]|nr:LacI family DNA-binding transcriptional regulator [Chloroflexia bacterium SDU3-3]